VQQVLARLWKVVTVSDGEKKKRQKKRRKEGVVGMRSASKRALGA